jgi:hypothetical protein
MRKFVLSIISLSGLTPTFSEIRQTIAYAKKTDRNMKKIILLTTFLLYVFCAFGQSKDTIYVQGDTVILKKDTLMRNLLISVNLKNYIGKPVEELLQNDTIKMYKNYWWSDESPGKLQSLNLTFARGLYIKIYPVRKNGQAVQFSMTNDFDIEAFKKLKIQELIIDKDYFEEKVVKKYSKKN